MRFIFKSLLKRLYGLKQRFFPDVCIERMFPAWNAVHRQLVLRAKATFAADVLGHRMHLDQQDSLQLSINSQFEPFETGFLLSRIKPGNVVVDIGANIGYYTLLFARAVGPTGHVYAFEPDPENFRLLLANVRENGYTNVTAVQKAVASSSGTARLFFSAENRADHRIYDSNDSRESFDIESVRLDDYFAPDGRSVDLIKMDVQGSEHGALVGMQELIRKNPNLSLVTEFWPFGLQKAGASAQSYLGLMVDLGFSLSEISEAAQTVRAVDPATLLRQLDERKSADFTNLLGEKRGRPTHFSNTTSAPDE